MGIEITISCFTIDGDGMLMNVNAIRIADVQDGTSNTLFVGEVTGSHARRQFSAHRSTPLTPASHHGY